MNNSINIGEHQGFLKAKLASMASGQAEQMEMLRQYLELERENIYRAISTPDNVVAFTGPLKLNADA